LDCGGKRSATPLWVRVEQSNKLCHSKALSPLRLPAQSKSAHHSGDTSKSSGTFIWSVLKR
jgi:hypothetical protein